MTTVTTDGQEAAPFDPHARYTHRDGIVYEDFVHYLTGEPDPQDRANRNIARYLREGRSTEFCRIYREGYEATFTAGDPEAAQDVKSQVAASRAEAHEAHHIKGFARATDPFQGRRPEEIADTPHNRAHVDGWLAATAGKPEGLW